MRSGPLAVLAGATLSVAAACGGSDDATDEPTPAEAPDTVDPDTSQADTSEAGSVPELFPDVLAVEATANGDEWTFAVTMSSPYDTPERYADGWRVLGPDGVVYGERPLAHDHQNEQPFTRSLSGVVIPAEVDEVTVEGRDQLSGWGGGTVVVRLER